MSWDLLETSAKLLECMCAAVSEGYTVVLQPLIMLKKMYLKHKKLQITWIMAS